MGSLFFLAGAGAVLLLAVVVLIVVLTSRGSVSGTDTPSGAGGGGSREEAIARLHAARSAMREERPDLAESARRAQAEAMKREIEAAGVDDPRKAAGNLQKLMD